MTQDLWLTTVPGGPRFPSFPGSPYENKILYTVKINVKTHKNKLSVKSITLGPGGPGIPWTPCKPTGPFKNK